MGMFIYIILLLIIAQAADAKVSPIISLGQSCTVAGALRDNGLRIQAYPFDWTVSPFNALYDSLAEDFQHFLQEDSLSIRVSDRYGILDYYGFHFVHDFPANQPNDKFAELIGENHVTGGIIVDNWKEYLPAVKEKYWRRIARLQESCLGQERVYFIRHSDTTRTQAIALRDLIIKKYPVLDFVLIILGRSQEIRPQWNLDRIYNFYLNENDAHEWKEIFKKFNFISVTP